MFKKRNPRISLSLEHALLFLEMAVVPWGRKIGFAPSQRRLFDSPAIEATETFATNKTYTFLNALMLKCLRGRLTPRVIFKTTVALLLFRQPDSTRLVQAVFGPIATDVYYLAGPEGIDRSPPVCS